MDRDAVVRLLCEILHGIPKLPDAACRGRYRLFDPLPGNGGTLHREREHARITRAAQVCATCPARPACTTVTTTLSAGIAAGTRRSSAVRRSAPLPPAA